MSGLRILITNLTLAGRTGTETYVRDLVLRLLRLGHTPIVYTTDDGAVGDEIRATTAAVVDDLDRLALPPDVIHGHHHVETMTALLRFPGVPAIWLCHDRLAWHDRPPLFPRVRRYVAVDDNTRDRLLFESGLPADGVRVMLNWVDLERFRPRGPLPARPQRALVFSNYADESGHLPAVRSACAAAGIPLDVVGAGVGRQSAAPEDLLGQYDLVFAKARAAMEAMATGAAVVLCDRTGAGPMVTPEDFDRLRHLNFGRRAMDRPLHADILGPEIARYDPARAAEVSRRIRNEAGLDAAADELVALYRDVIAEQAAAPSADLREELAAASRYLRGTAPFREFRELHNRSSRLDDSAAEIERLNRLLADVHGSRWMQLRRTLARVPLLGRALGRGVHP